MSSHKVKHVHACQVKSDSVWPWTVAHQAPLCPWDSPGKNTGVEKKKKKNTGVGCHALFQGIFLTQGSNPHLMSPALAGMFFTTSTT